MKFVAEPGSLFITDGAAVYGSALIAPSGKLPRRLDTLLRRAVGELGHKEISSALPSLEGHVLLVGGPIICMPGNLDQLYSALRSAGLPMTKDVRAALDEAYGEWPGAKGYETKKKR